MESIEWLEDKEKDGERFTNSICLLYCLKFFRDEKRVELWDLKKGYYKNYKTEAGALFEYEIMKSLDYGNILSYVEEQFDGCKS